MKKLTKTLSLVLVVAMVLSLCVIGAGATFTDNDKITKDYSEAVTIATDLGIVSGVGNNTFAPAGTFTRAQAAVILTKMTTGANAAAIAPTTVTFKDVPATFWGYKYIEYAAQAGLVAGIGNGKFSPNATLDGYQWALMLLKVLGFDSTGMTPANWQMLTAKAYYGNSKFSSVAITNAAVTREAATQMAYDALFSVSNGKTGYPIIDKATHKAVAVYPTVAEATMMANALGTTNYEPGLSVTTIGGTNLAGTVFGVDRNTTGADAFGRPANVYTCTTAAQATAYAWVNGVKTVAATPTKTYTAPVTSGKLFTDLGLTADIAVANVSVTVDNKAGTSLGITHSNTTDVYGGYGVLTEVYYDATAKTAKIIEVNTYIGSVTSVAPATAVAKRTVTIGGMTYATDSYTYNDVLLYTKAWDTKLSTPAFVIQSVSVPNSISGSVTKVTNGTAYTIGSATTYLAAQNILTTEQKTALNNLTAKGEWYVDAYGNIMSVKTATAATKYYGYLVGYAAKNYTPADLLGNSAVAAKEIFKFVDSTGAVVTKEGAFTADATTGAVTKFVNNSSSATDATGRIVSVNSMFEYTLDANGKIATVAAATASGADAEKTLTKGSATFDSKFMSDKTVIFYVDDTNAKYAAYTGYTNAPDKTTTVAYGYTGVGTAASPLTALVLKVSDVAGTSVAKYAYFASEAKTVETTTAGTVTTYTNVYLDGVKGELKFLGTDPAATAGQLFKYTTSTATGYATLVDANAATEGLQSIDLLNTAVTSIQSTYFVAGSTYYTDANTVYYQVDATAGTVTVVKAMTALSANNAYSVKLLYTDATGTNAADVVYFTVGQPVA